MNLTVSNRRLFLLSFAGVQIPGLIAVIMMAYWVVHYKGGFSSKAGLAFNLHPLLLSLGLIYLYGNGALIYRVFPSRNDSQKLRRKIAHAAIMLVTFVITVVGLQAAFDSHNLKTDAQGNPAPIPNLYTLHSWVGLIAVILFAIQGVLGFLGFLFPKFSPGMRSNLLPFHQYFGSAIFAMAVAAALMGLLEKAIWSIKENGASVYGKKGPEAMLVNFLGVMLLFFAVGVTFLLSKFKKDSAVTGSVDPLQGKV